MKSKLPEDPANPRSVLESIRQRTGLGSKVLLPDTGSEHGVSPVVAAGPAGLKWVPKGRGNYQMLGEIARGGMGVILKGHDTDLGRDLAIKVLDGELAKSPAVVQRFIEEAQIGGQLQHPGIVPVYELGLMADESPYFTMKLVKGRTLSALLQQRKQIGDNRGRLLSIFESVCQTVAYAHSKGVLHRDLKPANIMVGAFGEVQVVDWGLAKVLHRGGVADEKRAKQTVHTIIETVRSGPGSSGSDSMVGSVMGTPAYMAPEQAQGEVEKLDERADVFSLGAILCEILTGSPPYVDVEGESTVTKAAKAQLDPARERIEACEVDPALKQICLDCLTPARAARPANADEVAKAVHAYLSSVEERAQKAELAAVEARIKAAEERRARRLTVALAGTITAALLFGGGGFWWVGRQHEQRMAQTRAAVEAAHGESIQFGQGGKPADALAAARRALTIAETGGADAALLARAQDFVAKAELDLGAAERERKLLEQDTQLRARLVELRLAQIANLNNAQREAELDKSFAKAFTDYGVDLEGADVVPAMKRIRERDIAEEVALALDDWGRLRRKAHGAKSEKAENLYFLAMDLDADPLRQRMRQAIAESKLDVMLELTSRENLPKLQPGSIWVLSVALWDGFPERRPYVTNMYERAVKIYPADYVLQSVGAIVFQLANRQEESLGCANAALSLRPQDIEGRLRVADALLFLGRVSDALDSYRVCLSIDSNNAEALYGIGVCEVQLGEHTEAVAALTRSLELFEEPTRTADLVSARYYAGKATKSELERAAQGEPSAQSLLTYLYPLVDHPDAALRDPEFVLRILDARATEFASADWTWVPRTIAKVRLEDWRGALAAMEGHFVSPSLLVMTPSAFDFVRSLIQSKLGNVDAAKECFARGMAQWNEVTRGDLAAWEHSDVMRWRREAEAALAK
ncbi:MAG TPA: serine/threonine-protein kinase [Planctomycetota bacterium]|nr:serine/threonine-protein kinase [Planctomycetota bacterium]